MTYADEAHHVPAGTYQKIMKHFTPKLWLGMTATPDKRDDNVEGRNVYEIFNYQIAYEIRLQQAMEENLLCPFHYFGITDLSIIDDQASGRNLSMLTSDERVKHIIEQADYYGYSGDKIKGLIFCSSIRETEELSAKFNRAINPVTGQHFRTIALNGSASEQERQNAFERLAMNEEEATIDTQPLDYIFSVEIFERAIKEGGKFGFFLWISSQRPSDISSTTVSQMHNYFIHKLVNPHDLNKIRKAVAFLDQNAMDSLTVLGPGACIVSGSGIKMPSFIKIEQLEKQFRPNSENVILFGEEGIFESG